MRSKILVAFALIMILAGISTSRVLAQAPYPALTDTATAILKLVNDYRATKGLEPLQKNFYVTHAAEQHSRDMASQKIPFGHDEFASRMTKLGKDVHPANAFGENVAYGDKTAKGAFDTWINSEEHRKNIEGKYSITGIGVVKGKDGNLYFTQIFVYQSKK